VKPWHSGMGNNLSLLLPKEQSSLPCGHCHPACPFAFRNVWEAEILRIGYGFLERCFRNESGRNTTFYWANRIRCNPTEKMGSREPITSWDDLTVWKIRSCRCCCKVPDPKRVLAASYIPGQRTLTPRLGTQALLTVPIGVPLRVHSAWLL